MCGDRTGPTYINNQPEWPIKQVIHLNNQPEWPIKPSGTLSIQLKKESTAKKKLAKQFSNFNDLQQRILNILQTVYWRKWTCGILLLKLIFSLPTIFALFCYKTCVPPPYPTAKRQKYTSHKRIHNFHLGPRPSYLPKAENDYRR